MQGQCHSALALIWSKDVVYAIGRAELWYELTINILARGGKSYKTCGHNETLQNPLFLPRGGHQRVSELVVYEQKLVFFSEGPREAPFLPACLLLSLARAGRLLECRCTQGTGAAAQGVGLK